ncbi:MAG TPA: hypothetical protein VIY71_09660 [Solirubrobacterales bacterium]
MTPLLAQIVPLAHHTAVAALPVFAPALVVCIVLVVHFLRERRRWDEEPDEGAGGTA